MATNQTRLTLKSLRIYERMSKETLAFAANVYLDGRKIGDAENAGHGGSTMVMITSRPREPIEAAIREIAISMACVLRADGTTPCCNAPTKIDQDGWAIERCRGCDRMIDWRDGDAPKFLDGAEAFVVDALVDVEYRRKQDAKHERRLVKIDNSECAKNDARGYLTLRWTARDLTARGERATVWAAIRPGQTPDDVGREIDAERKVPGTWKVVS